MYARIQFDSKLFTSGKDTSHVDSVKNIQLNDGQLLEIILFYQRNPTTWSPLKWVTINGKKDTLRRIICY